MAHSRLEAIADEPLPIMRLTPEMVDDWLLGRLAATWPMRSPGYWRDRIADLSRSNDVLLITNGAAVLCAIRMPHLMSGIPEVTEIFVFSRAAQPTEEGISIPEEHHGPVVELYHRAREWQIEMGASRMVIGRCSDLTVGEMRRYLKGRYLMDVR